MKPWREIAVPHKDVLKGTFLQAEFAADITAVHAGKAAHEYQDAAAFFDRTYITEGMRLLLTQVVQRLSGKGGEPVIQLQTAFGGGKTHTMLAVLHLATRKLPLSDLPGVPTLVERAGLMDVPQARVAVIDGTALSPGQPWKHGRTTVKTLWGARRLGVNENVLHEWRKAHRERGDAAFPGHGNPSPADEEIPQLRAENARLRAERDLLKKTDRPGLWGGPTW